MTRSTTFVALLLVALAGAACGRGEEKGALPRGSASSTVATATTAPATTVGATTSTRAPEKLTAESRLRLDGIGPVRIGMTMDEVRQAAGVPLTLRQGPFCRELRPDGGPAGLALVFAQSERLNLITVGQGPVVTLAGIGVGSIEQQVLAAYPGQIDVRNPDARSHWLVFHAADPGLSRLSIVFVVNDGKVASFRSGDRTVTEADEACA